MLKIIFQGLQPGCYEAPDCELRHLQVQVPVLTSFETKPIYEADEEEWD